MTAMNAVALFVVLTAFCFCSCQDVQEIKFNMLNAVLEKLDALSQSLKELQSRLDIMQGSQNALEEKVESSQNALEEKVENILTKLGPLQEFPRMNEAIQECSTRDLQNLLETDECAEGTHECSEFATCHDALVNYHCSCLHGYTGDGFTCQDVDECSPEVKTTCHMNANCINTPGSYECVCSSGYSGDGVTTCVDIDECSTEVNTTCHINANCINTLGSYDCVCSSGYSGDGVTCVDIDECSISVNTTCHFNANCINTPGSFHCSCPTGYSGDGITTCVDKTCDSPSKTIKGLGCVTLVTEKLNWQDAKENCKRQPHSRLLEGITTAEQMQLLTEHFYGGKRENDWVNLGFYTLKWVEGADSVPSTLFDSGEPSEGSEKCGLIYLKKSKFHDVDCSLRIPSLCQKVSKM